MINRLDETQNNFTLLRLLLALMVVVGHFKLLSGTHYPRFPFNLADAYRKLGRPCDGIFPLEQLSFYNPERDANARRLLRELYDDPQCSDRLGTGKATLRFGSGARRVTARNSAL